MTDFPRTISALATAGGLRRAAHVTTPDAELLDHFNRFLNGTDDYVRLVGKVTENELTTINGGVASGDTDWVVLDTEGAGATDDLESLQGVGAFTGQARLIFLRATNAGRVITLKHSTDPETMNLYFHDAADHDLAADRWTLMISWEQNYDPFGNVLESVF